MKYRIKIHFESGYVKKITGGGDFDKSEFPLIFNEDILEGFYPRDKNQVSFSKPLYKQITGIELYWDGVKQKESPPLWMNGMGYVFSENGLERVVLPDKNEKLPDFHTDEETRKFDSKLSRLNMEKLHEEMTKRGIRKCTLDEEGNIIDEEGNIIPL